MFLTCSILLHCLFCFMSCVRKCLIFSGIAAQHQNPLNLGLIIETFTHNKIFTPQIRIDLHISLDPVMCNVSFSAFVATICVNHSSSGSYLGLESLIVLWTTNLLSVTFIIFLLSQCRQEPRAVSTYCPVSSLVLVATLSLIFRSGPEIRVI